jgi:DNA-binding response OmpR family regulator
VDQRRVLVVDDERALARIVGSYLQAEGFAVDLAHDGPTAVEAARDTEPELVVLDVMLPGFDGIEACRRIRQFSDCYIIMLTARDEEIDKVVGLSVGADDYLVKPFSPRELVARVRAMLRRPRTGTAAREPAGAQQFTAAGLIVDPVARQARLAGGGVCSAILRSTAERVCGCRPAILPSSPAWRRTGVRGRSRRALRRPPRAQLAAGPRTPAM